MQSSIKLLLVDNQSHHRILKVNGTVLKAALWFVPTLISLLIMALSILTFNSYKRISNVKETSQDQQVKWLEEEKALKLEIQTLEDQVQQLGQKLSSTAQDNQGSDKAIIPGGFNLLGQAAGSQDLTAKASVTMENLTFAVNNNVLDIKFELHNQSGTERVVGYFYVFIYAQGQLFIHPQVKLSERSLAFSEGESFNIGRFRTVIVHTPLRDIEKNIKTRIIAFNRTGDLLFNKLLTLK